MFDTITSLIPADPALPPRARALGILGRVLDGTLYDVLPYSFHDERTGAGEYIPLRKRRPSVRYGLCRVVVEDSVALLFSEGHFPSIEAGDAGLREVLAALAAETCLNRVMIEAALRGAVGSVAVLMRILRGRVFFSVLDTQYLTPAWDKAAPDVLLSVTERYRVAGSVLAANGYDGIDVAESYWFTRVWDGAGETWFLPAKDGESRLVDAARSVSHGLGFVPLVWIRNLPGVSATGDACDGACTFRAAIETSIEIDYQLSQAGRGLKYSSDPTLLIKEPAGFDGTLVKSAANALVLSDKGDAKLLEIGGTASAAVLEYVRLLRELALESVHGSRASPERLSVAHSGRALEMLNQGLIWLSDNLRVSYGEGGLLALLRMVLRASQLYPLTLGGKPVAVIDPEAALRLRWPPWYPDSAK